MRCKKTERGWAAHFCCAHRCKYRRNTLIECGDRRLIVSSVGAMMVDDVMTPIGGCGPDGIAPYYETAVFSAKMDSGYWEADILIHEDRPCYAMASDPERLPDTIDSIMDAHHDATVREWTRMLRHRFIPLEARL